MATTQLQPSATPGLIHTFMPKSVGGAVDAIADTQLQATGTPGKIRVFTSKSEFVFVVRPCGDVDPTANYGDVYANINYVEAAFNINYAEVPAVR